MKPVGRWAKFRRWWRDANRHWINDVYYIERDGAIRADLGRLVRSKEFQRSLEIAERIRAATSRSGSPT